MKQLLFTLGLFFLIGCQSFAQCSTTISGTLTSCTASCNGSVIFTSYTGTPPYNLVVTGGPSVQYTSSYTWANVCAGSYHYDVTDATMLCHDTGTVVVTAITPTTPPTLTIEAFDLAGSPANTNNPTVCQFQHIDFFIYGPYPFINVLPNTYTWKVNGNPVLVQNNLASYLNASYSTSSLATGDIITLEVSWPNACMLPNPSVSQNITFTVTPNQPPVLIVTDNSLSDTICFGSTITFTANPFEAGTPTYQWYLDAVPVGTASIYTTLTTLLVGNHQIYCCITSSDYCDTQDPIFNPTVCSDTISFYVQPCASVPEQSIETAVLTIEPNPVSGELRIKNAELKIENIEIYNVLGKKIFSQQLKAKSQKQITVDVSGLTSGIYFIKAKGDKEERTGKFVKH